MEKALKVAAYTFAGVILAAVVISYVSYSTYWAKDPAVAVDRSNLVYYHETYNECRDAFVAASENLRTLFDSVQTGRIMVPDKSDNDLSVDWCYIPARGEQRKLLILNSGLHGIEGYTGSAIQLMFMERVLPKQLPGDMGLLLLHGLNPYGFKYHRKVTGNNVDLNRNCVVGSRQFDIRNDGFRELTGMLMPTGPANIATLYNRFFYMVAIYKILQESMPVLRQAALQGQYEFDKGFYYGGSAYEPQIDSLKPFLTGMIGRYKTVLNIDLHTGYGARGVMHPFIDKPEDPAVLNGVEKIFEGVKIDWGSSSDFYTVNGEYTVWLNNLVPGVLCIPMLFEFGTLDSQKTFGSLKSMQVMILENQGAHYGYKNKKNEQKIRHLFDEMYIPSSEAWRSKVISDSYDMMSRTVTNFEKF